MTPERKNGVHVTQADNAGIDLIYENARDKKSVAQEFEKLKSSFTTIVTGENTINLALHTTFLQTYIRNLDLLRELKQADIDTYAGYARAERNPDTLEVTPNQDIFQDEHYLQLTSELSSIETAALDARMQLEATESGAEVGDGYKNFYERALSFIETLA